MFKSEITNRSDKTDEEIVEQIKSGEYELLPLLIERYLPYIIYFTEKYCNERDKEDAIQEATLALYSAIKTFDSGKSSFSTFASICIKRSVLSGLKSSGRKKKVPDELISSIDGIDIPDRNNPEEILLEKESLKDFAQTIKLELSGLEYKVLNLHLYGFSHSVIAEKLGISEKSVDNSLTRVRKKLKKVK